MEMDALEEMCSNVDMEVQIKMKKAEPDVYKEDRLSRVKTRQREFWTRKAEKEIMEDVLGRVMVYRPVQEAKGMLDWMLEEVIEQAWLNTMFREVTDTGPSAVSKLELKVSNRQAVVHMV